MRRLVTTALCLAGLAVIPASAGAAQTIGIDQTTDADGCGANSLNVSTTTDYVVPFNSVVTQISTRRGAANGKHFSMKIVRDVLATQTIQGTTGLFTTQNTLVTYAVRVSARAGDRLGVWAQEIQDCAFASAGNGLSAYAASPDPVVGTVFAAPANNPNKKLGLTARLEADADNDGFGDETQDLCPSQAGTQGPCVAAPAAVTCKVPSLKGKTKSAAETALKAANCKLGATKKKKLKKFTKKQKKNRVRSQTISAGNVRPNGTAVGITINTKKK